tara:strand:+ start:698 stop:868 length:171 start_codon:yes stop_codon:yes gene_type:complete
MKISIERLKEIIMEEVARATAIEIDENQEGSQELATVEGIASIEELEEPIEIVDDE